MNMKISVNPIALTNTVIATVSAATVASKIKGAKGIVIGSAVGTLVKESMQTAYSYLRAANIQKISEPEQDPETEEFPEEIDYDFFGEPEPVQEPEPVKEETENIVFEDKNEEEDE